MPGQLPWFRSKSQSQSNKEEEKKLHDEEILASQLDVDLLQSDDEAADQAETENANKSFPTEID